VLEAIEPDAFGRRTYTLDSLAHKMKAVRCPAKSRTIQSYLKALRSTDEIVTAQIGGNGTPYAVLTGHFGGADNSQKRVETTPELPMFGGADRIAEERILTPQNAETSPQCKEDHQNPSTPTPAPQAAHSGEIVAELGGAFYVPGRDWTNGGRLDLSGWCDPSEIRIPSEPIDRTPPRDFRRQQRQKGQESFLGRGGAIAAKITRKKHHGEAPAPAPYRPRAALVTESLPDPPAAAAPAGAQGAGAPLPAPAGAAPVDIVERLRLLKAEREAVHG
jgi:hypothetical protein